MESIKKRLNIRVPAMASIWYISSSIVARGLSVLVTPIFTRLMSPDEYGLFPLYNTWLGLFTVIVTLELSGGVVYRALQKFPDKKSKIISSTFGLFLTIFTIFSLIYLLFQKPINEITGLNTRIMLIMLLQILANATVTFYTARARYEYRYKSVAFINVITAILTPLISLILLYTFNIGGESRIFGSCLGALIVAIPIGYLILQESHTLFNKDVWKFLLRFNIPLIPHYLAMTMILRVGEISVGRSFGNDALGRYSVAMSVGMGLTIVTSGLLAAMSPWILRKLQKNETDAIKDFLLMSTKGLCAACLMILAVAPEIIHLLTPKIFHSSLPAVYPLELAVIPMFLSGALISAEGYYEKTSKSALPSIITAVISMAFALIVLPTVDYRYVSVFVLVCYVILTVLRCISFKELSGSLPINVFGTVATFLLTLAYATLIFLLRNAPVLRILAALPIIPAAVKLAKNIYTKVSE